MRVRHLIASALALAVLAAACGNSKSGTSTSTTTVGSGNPSATTAPGDVTKKVPRPGVPGVTDSAIRVSVITAKTNPIGGRYYEYTDGIKAYFKKVNDAGGIYGRKLQIASERDDNVGLLNAQMTTTVLSDDKPFAVFEATQQLIGLPQLVKKKMPTFIWNINTEFPSKPNEDHSMVFGSVAPICFTCPGPLSTWLATQKGFTKVGILAYGVSAQSKACAQGQRSAFKKYSNGKVQVAFYDDTIPFAGDVAADVANMKQAGVQLVLTCMDNNETLKLQKEMKKQQLGAVQIMPNSYDQKWLKENGALFEGSLVATLYVPKEAQPMSPATKEFYDNIGLPEDKIAEITEVGWIMAKMFVDGLKGAGPEFTQQKLVDYLNTQSSWSGGGLVQPLDWTKGRPDPQTNPSARGQLQCQPVMEIKGGKFVMFQDVAGKPWTCLDINKDATQPVQHLSFAPGGVG